MDLKGIFINEFGRLRSGLRFGIFATTFAFLLVAVTTVVALAATAVFTDLKGHTLLLITVTDLVLLVAALVSGWLFGRVFENLPFRALGAWFRGDLRAHRKLSGRVMQFANFGR